jgi:hypothetical protein
MGQWFKGGKTNVDHAHSRQPSIIAYTEGTEQIDQYIQDNQRIGTDKKI